MPKKHRYGVPVGKSGCRFLVRGGRRGVEAFPLTAGGYGDAVRHGWNEVKMGRVNVGIELVCGPDVYRSEGGRRIPIAECYKGATRPECYAPAWPSEVVAVPIAGLRRRRR